jgi:hypothetical protein
MTRVWQSSRTTRSGSPRTPSGTPGQYAKAVDRRDLARQYLRRVRPIRYPHSLGLLYSAFTNRCCLKPNEEEYILMGMAGFGTPGLPAPGYSTGSGYCPTQGTLARPSVF